tara:strand:- start:5881 stop:6264 length:384 start_codon:yes stop_codon:yes gene_type:complete
MIKSVFAAAAAAVAFAPAAALAGPYVNIESNSGFGGSDYDSTLLETHVGYESPLGESASWYIQGGPALSFVDGEEGSTTELSGKVGLSVAATENLSVYGEVAAITTEEINFDEDLNANIKLGVKYNF